MTTTALERDGYVLGRNTEEYERLRAQARSWNRGDEPPARRGGPPHGRPVPGRRLRSGGDDAADGRAGGPGRPCSGSTSTPRSGRRRAIAAPGRPRAVRVPPARPHGGPADTRGAVRPGVRAAPALPPAAAGRRPAPAVGSVTPGGLLLVQDYDLRGVSALPALPAMDVVHGLLVAGMTPAGCDVAPGRACPCSSQRPGSGTRRHRRRRPHAARRGRDRLSRRRRSAACSGGTRPRPRHARPVGGRAAAMRREVGRPARIFRSSCRSSWGVEQRGRTDPQDLTGGADVAGQRAADGGSPRSNVRRIRGHFDFARTGRVMTNECGHDAAAAQLLELYAHWCRSYENVTGQVGGVAAHDVALRGVDTTRIAAWSTRPAAAAW